MALNDNGADFSQPPRNLDYVRAPELPSAWQRLRWLLIPLVIGIALLSWGLYRLRQPAPPTVAETLYENCAVQPETLALSAADEDAFLSEQIDGVQTGLTAQREPAVMAIRKICAAHVCATERGEEPNLVNLVAEEFAFAGTAINDTHAEELASRITTAPWCHG